MPATSNFQPRQAGAGYRTSNTQRTKRPATPPVLTLAGADTVAIRFDYRPQMVRALKLTGAAHWDPRRKSWVAAATKAALKALAGFIRAHGVQVAPEIRSLWPRLPDGKPVRPRTEEELDAMAERPQWTAREIVASGDRLAIRFPYDAEDVEAARSTGARWVPERGQWELPATRMAILAIRPLLQDHGFISDHNALSKAWRAAQ
jgi:hypothetical protein